MPEIRILPEHIANQIAAGEVVEGPSSIIKELVENSIDAKATKIIIDISKNLRQIQVIDDGLGMSSEDLKLAFKKHATSKISSIEDLYKLITNGFRGEALASISAVSTSLSYSSSVKSWRFWSVCSCPEILGNNGSLSNCSLAIANFNIFRNTTM